MKMPLTHLQGVQVLWLVARACFTDCPDKELLRPDLKRLSDET